MKKSTFVGNLVAWLAIAAACCAFLAWWHLGEGIPSVQDVGVQLGVMLASPMLLFAIGVLLGLVVVWFKRVLVRRVTKRACRVVGVLALALVLSAGVPVLVPSAGEALLGPAVVVVYVTMVAPLLIVVLGFAYAIGCAGVDKTRRGRLAKYLPDDHFE